MPRKPKVNADDGETETENGGQYHPPNMVEAKKIHDLEIKPGLAVIATKKGDIAEPYKKIKDDCHCPRLILNFLVALDNMEEHKRDHHLLALREGLLAYKLFMPSDMVTKAKGEDGQEVVPTKDRDNAPLAALAEEMAEEDISAESEKSD